MAHTSLQFDSLRPRLKLCVREEFSAPDNVLLSLRAEVDTQTGQVVPYGSLRKQYFPESCGPLTRVEVGSTLRRDRSVAYGARAHAHYDLTADGLLHLTAKLGVAAPAAALRSAIERGHSAAAGYSTGAGAAAAARARKVGAAPRSRGGFDLGVAARGVRDSFQPQGFVEVSQVVLNFNSPKSGPPQDVKVSLGWDVERRQPYFALKENCWAVRADLKGRFAFSYEL